MGRANKFGHFFESRVDWKDVAAGAAQMMMEVDMKFGGK